MPGLFKVGSTLEGVICVVTGRYIGWTRNVYSTKNRKESGVVRLCAIREAEVPGLPE